MSKQLDYYFHRKASGLCVGCGGVPAKKKGRVLTLCPACSAKRKAWNQAARERKATAIPEPEFS